MQKPNKEDKNLIGTLVSVFLLGFMILGSWFGMFALYFSRQ